MMSNISFQRGEILTAAKLNELVQAVTGEPTGAAAGDGVRGGGIPVQTHQVKQREFSSYLPPKHPVYIDQASPHWPLASGNPGWFWRETSTSALTRLPVQPQEGDTLYLNTTYSPLGYVSSQELSLSPGSNQPAHPWPCVKGSSSSALGTFQKDIFRAGALSDTLRFFDAPATDALPLAFYSAPSTTNSWGDQITSILPPGTYYSQYSLVTNACLPTIFFPALQTDGGMIFRATSNLCQPGLPERNVQLIPRFALLEPPSTVAPLTPSEKDLWVPPELGKWHKVASVLLNGTELSLNLQWVKPWFAYVNFSTKNVSAFSPIHQTWKADWGLPQQPAPPAPFSVQANDWRVVSKSGPQLQVIHPGQFPAACSWVMTEDVILQAEGTGCAETDENCNVVALHPVLFQAYLRRKVAPKTCDWRVWYDDCWTQTPWK